MGEFIVHVKKFDTGHQGVDPEVTIEIKENEPQPSRAQIYEALEKAADQYAIHPEQGGV